MGKDRADKYLRDLAATKPVIVEGVLPAAERVTTGETPIAITYGSLETPEFQRQGRDFHAALVKAGKPVKLYVGEAYNHFETQETMHSPYGLMGHAIFELMGMR